MQFLRRSDTAPAVLCSKQATRSRRDMQEFLSLPAERLSQTSVPAIGVDATSRQLVDALSNLTGGRCAFCEARDKLVAHRFRPAGNALPLANRKGSHLFYIWLADAWQNLLPICSGCRPEEPRFPVFGNRCRLPTQQQIAKYVEANTAIWATFPPDERTLLLDPGLERLYERHFAPRMDGILIGLSAKGSETIATFRLNRDDRKTQRARRYQAGVESLCQLIFRAHRGKPYVRDDKSWRDLFDFDNMEFGGTFFLLLKRVARAIGGSGGVKPRTSRTTLQAYFKQLALDGSGDPVQAVRDALSAIELENASLRSKGLGPARAYSIRSSVREVEIKNFKTIESLKLTLPPPIKNDESGRIQAAGLMLLGENATGKSSVLEAVALTLATEQAREALDLAWRNFPLDPSQMGSEETGEKRTASVTVHFDSGQSARLTVANGAVEVRDEFGSECVPIFAYGAFRRYLTLNRKFTPQKHIRNLFDGSTLANPEPWLKSLPGERFDMVIRVLRGMLSIDGDFEVVQRVGRSRQLRMVTGLEQPDGTIREIRTPLQMVSSGYRSMLAMVCDILRGLLDENMYEGFDVFETARGVVLIDEIEAHLHPRWKVQVMSSLRNALPGITFIVTTHDPLCLRSMKDDEIVVLQRVASSDAGVRSRLPTAIEAVQDLPPASGLRLEQLLTSDFFQMLSTDDPAADAKLASVVDLLAAGSEPDMMTSEDRRILGDFQADIAGALPVGSSEVHRIVQSAVARYLEKRRTASSETLKSLSNAAKEEILVALEGY